MSQEKITRVITDNSIGKKVISFDGEGYIISYDSPLEATLKIIPLNPQEACNIAKFIFNPKE